MRLDVSKGLSHEDLCSPIANFIVPVSTAFYEEMSIEEVLAILRKRRIHHQILYFYAVDSDYKLTGVIATRDLLLSDPGTKLSNLIQGKVLKILQTETLESGLRFLDTHGIQAVPVVDSEGLLKGLFEIVPELPLHTHEASAIAKQPTSKDVYQLIGLSLHLGRLDSTMLEYRYRMPWLLCNMVAGLICATVGAIFADTLHKYVILAMFIPLVLSLGESVAIQSMSFSLQFLHYGKMHRTRMFRRIFVEWKTAILLGFTCALLVGSVFWVWHTSFQTMLAVTISIFFAMVISTSLGTLFPLLLHSMSLDPKVASGPVVLMLTDIMATITYLAFSNWLLTTFPG